MTGHQLELSGATYKYGRALALDGINLLLPTGLTGLVGPNGAGKSTAMRILAGITVPASGALHLDGQRISTSQERSHLRGLTGFLPQHLSWDRLTSVREYVQYSLTMYGFKGDKKKRASEALELTAIGHLANRPIARLSGGEQRRAFLAGAISHNPEILILDEPTAGLDPSQRISFRTLIHELSEDKIVVVSTHLIEDLGMSADSIVLIQDGRDHWVGTPKELASLGERTDGMTQLESGYLSVSAS